MGYAIYEILLRIKKYKKYVYIMCGVIIVASFAYLCAVHYGLYDFLELKGLNTKGRNLIYGHINTLFEINPVFMGNGLGFSSKSWDLPFYSKLFQDAYHNEFLKMYVEMGFCGYFVWIFLHLPFRVWYFIRVRGQACGLMYLATAINQVCGILFGMTAYLFMTQQGEEYSRSILCITGMGYLLINIPAREIMKKIVKKNNRKGKEVSLYIVSTCELLGYK